MTLSGVIALILRFLAKFDCFAANYVTVVEDRPIMSVSVVSQFQSSAFGYNPPCSAVSLRQLSYL